MQVIRHTFPKQERDQPYLISSLDHQSLKLRTRLQMPKDFVIHSLRHTMLTRLGEFGMERAFKRLQEFNNKVVAGLPEGKELLLPATNLAASEW